jgi:hypothetical protein
MDQSSFVAQCSIDHFHRKLVTEQDEAKQKMIFRLLAAERAKLTAQNPPLAAMLALLARAA